MLIDISEGIELFNDSRFFEAHDYFEALWIESSGRERLFYQGMVQIAVGCFHLLSGNHRGSLNQFKKGTQKLEKYLPNYFGVNLEKLLKEVDGLMLDLQLHFDDKLEKIDIEKIPIIEFIKPN